MIYNIYFIILPVYYSKASDKKKKVHYQHTKQSAKQQDEPRNNITVITWK